MTATTTRAAAALAAAGLAWGATTTAPAETFRWINPAGGAWTDRQNWDPAGSPLQDDVALFVLPEAFSVETPLAVVRRAIFRAGEVRLLKGDFQHGGLSIVETDPVYPPGLLVGDTPSGSATLTSELLIHGQLSMVGFEGAGILEMSNHLLTDELLVGVRSGAAGAVVIAGPETRLDGRGDPGVPVERVALGLGGIGSLALRDGAVGRVRELQFAREPDARGELTLAGEGTRLQVETITLGEGDAVLTVNDGAALALPEGAPLALNLHGEQRVDLLLDGGSLTGATAVQVDEFEEGLTASLALLSGSDLDFSEELIAHSLTIVGEGSSLSAPIANISRSLELRDGAAVMIGRPADAETIHAFSELGAEVVIDDATVLFDDGVAVTQRGHTRSSIGTSRRSSADAHPLLITNGSRIDAEGGLNIFASAPSVIDGGARIRQRLQAARESASPFTNSEIVERGLLRLMELGRHDADARITIRDGATAHGSFVQCAGRITLEGDGSAVISDTRLTLIAGDFVIRNGARAQAEVVVLRPEGSTPGRLAGDGSIVGAFSNAGQVDPGAQSSPGTLRIKGDFIQRPHTIPPVETAFQDTDFPSARQILAGELRIDIAGRDPGEHDRLEVSGSATLGGTLRATLAEGFQPVWGDRFVFLTAGAIDPGFETLEAPPAPPGLVWEVEFIDAAAALALHRKSDLTRDLTVDAQDLGVLLAQWGLPDSPADLNGDGFVDGADLGRLLAQWGLRAN